MVMSDESFALFNKVAATCRAASRYPGSLTKDSHIKDLSKDLLELNANTIDSRGGTSIQNHRKTTTAVKVSIRKSRVFCFVRIRFSRQFSVNLFKTLCT